MKKPEVQPESPPDPLEQHRQAHALLAGKLAEYRQLVPEREELNATRNDLLSQAERACNDDELDRIFVRVRSIEFKQEKLTGRIEQCETSMQGALSAHIERAQRLVAFVDQRRLEKSLTELRAFFPSASSIEPQLRELAPLSRCFLEEGKIAIPQESYAWKQPLIPLSQKFNPPPGVNDPLWKPAERCATVAHIITTAEAMLKCELELFERLKSEKDVPAFAKPEAATTDISQYLGWNKPVRISPVSGAIEQQERIA